MSKFHINKHGVPAPCKATKGNCPLGGEERHFDSQEAAQEYADKVNAEEHGVLPGINSNESRTITHDAENEAQIETQKEIENLLSEHLEYLQEEGELEKDPIVQALMSNYLGELENEEEEEDLEKDTTSNHLEELKNEEEEEYLKKSITTMHLEELRELKKLFNTTGITKFDERGSEQNLKIVAEDFKEEIKMQQEDSENNYGLLFYRHGHNGKAQTETREYYRREYGVDVF